MRKGGETYLAASPTTMKHAEPKNIEAGEELGERDRGDLQSTR